MKRRTLLRVAGAGALTGFAGCAGDNGDGGGDDGGSAGGSGGGSDGGGDGGGSTDGGNGGGGTVKIGIVTTLSGPFAHYGENTNIGTEYAIEEVNGSDEILPNTTLEFESFDSETDPEAALSAARNAVSQYDADILAGPVISSVAGALAGFAADRDIPFVFTSRDRSLTTGENCQPTTYRPGVCHTQSLAGGVAQWATNSVGSEGYVLYQDYSYGQSNLQWATTYAEQEGGEIIGSIGLPIDNTDFSSAIDQIAEADPDWLFNTYFGGTFTAYLDQAGSRGLDIPVMSAGIDGSLLADMGQEGYEASPEVYNFEQWSPAVDTPEAEDFRDAILEETGGLPIEYMVAPYHNIKFIADVIHEAGGAANTDQFRQVTEQGDGFSYNGLYEEDVLVRACDHQALLPLYNNRWTGVDSEIPWAEYELVSTVDTADVITSCADAECQF